MKQKIIAIIGNGYFYGLAFFVLSLLLGYYLTSIGWQKNIGMAFIMGVSALLVNGLLYSRFSQPLKCLENISVELDGSEKLLLEAPANHLIQNNLLPGKLFLTDRRIIFRSYGTDKVTLEEVSWNRLDLVPAGFFRSIQNSGGEFLLKKKDDVSLMFEVDSMKPWKDAFVFESLLSEDRLIQR
jgi:hypothetical protein